MYWGQVATGLSVAFIIGYGAFLSGWGLIPTSALAVVVYVIVRWAITLVYRVRHWYRRGTAGVHHDWCPNCDSRRHRVGGDWVLECKHCGWQPGPPVLRWITRSVPVRQLRRTVAGPKLVAVVVAGVIMASSGVGALVAPVGAPDDPDIKFRAPNITIDKPDFGIQSPNVSIPTQEPTPTTPTPKPERDLSTGTPVERSEKSPERVNSGDKTPTSFNDTLVKQKFLNFLNSERQSRDLQTLTLRDELTEMGQSHAENMAEHGYMGHVQPDGTTISDRYRERGLLPECRLEIEGTDRFYEGAENAAQTWFNRQVQGSYGTMYIGDEQDLARNLFQIWINSPPHRKAMLVYSADEMGLGISINSEGKVYAALELC